MIKLNEGGIYEMWRAASSAEARAYSYALQQAVKLLMYYADNARCYCMIDNLSETVLDYLAVEMRAMYYDQSMDVDAKRNIIKNTLKWYMHAGTVSALEEMSDIVFGGAEIIEWPDFTEPPYTPGTFDLITDAQITEDDFDSIVAIIKKVKNARSHLRKIFARTYKESRISGGKIGAYCYTHTSSKLIK